ncbi:MAG: PEP-CTERM sorting domain-containing protein [Nitrococcus sp.]|nr:PEP-CTERM sorting domain-containing protein [Nitrococcus sp.]
MQRKRKLLLTTATLALAGLGLTTGNALAAPIVEDFEGYSVGTDLVGTGGWDSETPSDIIAEVRDDPAAPGTGNNVGFFERTAKATPSLYLDLGANAISDGALGEFSVRFLFDESTNSSVFGLSTLANPGSTSPGYGAGTQLLIDFRLGGDTSPGRDDLIYMTDQGHSQGPTLASNLNPNTWYELSATIDNAANTVSNFILNGVLFDDGTYGFNEFAAQDNGALQTFFVYEQGFTAGLFLDDIRVGETAVSAVPAPSSVVLLAMGLGLILLMRSRKPAEGGRRI